jgi:hypothetical protein
MSPESRQPSRGTCRGHCRACTVTPARVHRVFPRQQTAVLCDACAAYLRGTGMGIEDGAPR